MAATRDRGYDMAMMSAGGTPDEVLASARTVVLVDWPTKDVPESLARAGLEVFVHGGPAPDDYTTYEVVGGEVATRRVGRPPDHADLVYSYRPVEELPDIVALAQQIGAATIWIESALSEDDERRARATVESAGLRCITEPSIVYVARRVRESD